MDAGAVTINGNGHTILLADDITFVTVSRSATGNLTMENVTIDYQGGCDANFQMIIVNAPPTLHMTDVTLQNHQGRGGILITNSDGQATSTRTSTLTRVTFKGFRNPNDPNHPGSVTSYPLLTIGQYMVVNIDDCSFIDNESKDRAPLYAFDRSTINVGDCVFRDNKAAANILARSGGIVNMRGNIEFSGTGTTVDFSNKRIDIEDDTAAGVINDERPAPSAEFVAYADSDDPMLWHFDASASTGTISSYEWDFGDGGSGSGAITTHLYRFGGPYTVYLTVSGGAGDDRTGRGIEVAGPRSRPGRDSDDRDDDSGERVSSRVVRPTVKTCPLLPAHIEVFNIAEGTQCQQVDAAGVGNADVLAAGFRDAVDIWGWVPPDVRVCFRVAGGSFKFLDAATAPERSRIHRRMATWA